MLVYAVRSALLEGDPLGDGDVVELFLHCEDAEQFLGDCLEDEPGWRDVLESNSGEHVRLGSISDQGSAHLRSVSNRGQKEHRWETQ
jgi:hypothetical protein